MFKGAHQAREYAAQIRRIPAQETGVDIVVCPPYVSLEATLQGLGADSGIEVYAQNVHWELEGAFTGEVSAPMLLELGVTGAVVGHSERRQYFGETDETVRMRAETAPEAGLRVIACVGDGGGREAGGTGPCSSGRSASSHGTSGSSSPTSPCGRSAPERRRRRRSHRRRTRS